MTYTRFLTFLAGTALVVPAHLDSSSTIQQQTAPVRRSSEVRVESSPRIEVLSREITGSYAQHPAMLAELLRFISETEAQSAGPVMGIYPMDPDLVSENQLRWQVAVPIASSLSVRRPYTVTVLPPTETVAISSSVRQLESDSQFLKKWVIANGFVQSGATRTLFHNPEAADPLAVKITIVYPVERRAAPHAAAQQPVPRSIRDADVRIAVAPRTQVLSRDIKGSYSQHPAVFTQLRRYLSTARVEPSGPVMGIYPMDPDVVPEDQLRWQVAVPVAASLHTRSPYWLRVLPAADVVSLDSTVAESHHDGLFLKKWVIENGFVQTAPTRMLFHDLDNPSALDVKTTIMFPVKRRGVTADLLKRPHR